MSRKLILIDGNSLIYRAFFALPPFTTQDGTPTNGVHGFLTMLFKLIEDEKPTHIAVAFDKSEQTFRNVEYAEYKAHRAAMPDDLRRQLPILRETLKTLGIATLEKGGYEADDILGTLSLRAEQEGWHTLVVTGDRDALQLVSDRTHVVMTRKGISETIVYDEARLRQDYELEPRQIIDLKGLMGDTSDNIPGVPGVGEKTALKLLKEYGDVETALAHAEEIKGKLGETLRTHAEMARLSKRLATIDRHSPIDVDLDQLAPRKPDPEQVVDLFRRLEFKTLLKRATDIRLIELEAGLPQAAGPVGEQVPFAQVSLIESSEALASWLERGRETGVCSLLLASPLGKPKGLAVAPAKNEAAYLPFGRVSMADAVEVLLPYLTDETYAKVSHDAKALASLAVMRGLQPRGFVADTTLEAYLLDPTRSQYRIEQLARDLVQAHPTWDRGDQFRGKEGLEAPQEEAAEFWGTQAAAVLSLHDQLSTAIEANGMHDLFHGLEMQLIPALARMEVRGVRVDREGLVAMSRDVERRIDELTQEIYRLADGPFNINSTKQLADVLFVQLGLPVIKKTKTGVSTDADVLEELTQHHPIAQKLLDYRVLVKLKGTYLDGLQPLVHPETSRIHTTYNQTVAATGRLSSESPNLQNIPIRIEEGRKIRKVFITEPGYTLVAADYSQIELRVLAHYTNDPGLTDAFARGQDIHTRTASEVFGVPMDEVTSEQRTVAKAVNFGLAYGQTTFGLARALGLPQAEAKAFIESYFNKYGTVKRYMEEQIEHARKYGYVTTLLNRRRYIPDINHRTPAVRQAAERTAINTPIQGSAADIIKKAMLALDRYIVETASPARMILQVHDELIFEVPDELVNGFAPVIKREMEGAMKLNVPVVAEVKCGRNWYDMKKIAL